MDFGHDTQCNLGTVVDLVNTAPEISGGDGLTALGDLTDFVARLLLQALLHFVQKSHRRSLFRNFSALVLFRLQ